MEDIAPDCGGCRRRSRSLNYDEDSRKNNFGGGGVVIVVVSSPVPIVHYHG